MKRHNPEIASSKINRSGGEVKKNQAMAYFCASNSKYEINQEGSANAKPPPTQFTKKDSITLSAQQAKANIQDEPNSENCPTRTLLVTSRKGVVREGWLKAMTLKCRPPIKGFKIITPSSSRPAFALMEFENGADAMSALNALKANEATRRILKVVAYRESNALSAEVVKIRERAPTLAPTRCYKIFVGNLDEACTAKTLLQLFNYFGPISSCNVVQRQGGTEKFQPFGFVSFVNKEDAERAITESDDLTVRLRSGVRKLNVGWSKKFPPDLETTVSQFQRVFTQTDYENTTVTFGMISGHFSLQDFISAFPVKINQIRSFVADRANHQAHVNFASKEMATWAILSRDILINGRPVTRDWSMGFEPFPICGNRDLREPGFLALPGPGFCQLTADQFFKHASNIHSLPVPAFLPIPDATANLWDFHYGYSPSLCGPFRAYDQLGNSNGFDHLQYTPSGCYNYQRFIIPPTPLTMPLISNQMSEENLALLP